jgi:hypothetical protein
MRIPTTRMCAGSLISVFKIVVSQRGHPPNHPVSADAPLGDGLILLQHVCSKLVFFSLLSKAEFAKSCSSPQLKLCALGLVPFLYLKVTLHIHPPSHPVGADAPTWEGLRFLQQAFFRLYFIVSQLISLLCLVSCRKQLLKNSRRP